MAYIRKQGGFTPDMLREAPLRRLIDKTTDALMQGVDYGLADSEIPAAMADKLSTSVFVFSGCKTYQQLREASQLLRDDDGQVKPFGRYYEDVKALHPTYNEQYLDAEYRFAVHSAQAAAQWADIEQDGDEYDLQYRTANDGKVRPDHAVLEGITLPPSDPFWRQYYPPNGWRCRCRAIQVRRGKTPQSDSDTALRLGAEATTKVDKQGRNKAEMFRFNPGLDQIVFPPHHPYYNLSVQAKAVIIDLSKSSARADKLDAYQYKPKSTDESDEVYLRKYFKSGGFIETPTIGKQTKNEAAKNLRVATEMAKLHGDKIRLQPLNPRSKDTQVDALNLATGKKTEFKVPTPTGDSGKNAIQSAVKEASRQGAKDVVVFFESEVSRQSVYLGIKSALQGDRGRRLDNIVIRFCDKEIKRYNVADVKKHIGYTKKKG